MDIDRYKDQNANDTAKVRVEFCLDQLTKARGFSKNIDWDTEIVNRLTVEELIGALVSSEQFIKNNYEELEG